MKQEGPEPVVEGKKPVHEYAPTVGRKGSRNRRHRRTPSRDRTSPPPIMEKDLSDSSPVDTFNEKTLIDKPFARAPAYKGSAEDITALPNTKELGTSPHLRPVTHDQPVPYNFNLQHNASQVSVPSARDRGKLQRPTTLRSKRSSQNDSNITRRRSSKRRKDDHVREEEIRAMSAPIPIKRPTTYTGAELRRDSKKYRSGLGRHPDRPSSNVSLPLEDSIHSSMSGHSDLRTYMVSPIDIFAPRPLIRSSLNSQYTAGGLQQSTTPNASRSESRREKKTTPTKDTLKESRTIDNLAEDMDVSDIRELMERDQRRREKKRKAEEERIRKRLERRAEKQRAKEQRRDERREEDQPHSGTLQRDVEMTDSVGLGIQDASRVEPTTEDLGTTNTGTYLDYPAQSDIPANPFTDAAAVDAPRAAEVADVSKLQQAESSVEALPEAHGTRIDMSPPASPVHHARGPSNISQLPDLATHSIRETPEPADDVQAVPPIPARSERRRSSTDIAGRKIGSWTSIFRRGGTMKRGSMDRGRGTPSEASFSNTSRESMSRQPPPAHLVGTSQRRSKSGTPVRTQSKFREDLPELPLSPPDSRVQSPEISTEAAKAIAARRGYQGPSNIYTTAGASLPGSAVEEHPSQERTDSPVSPSGRASGLMSRSMASVDSEGSWLSGKPMKRASQRDSHTRESMGAIAKKPREDFNASYEELSVPDDEYFRRLTPQPNEHRRSGLSGFASKPSSSALAGAAETDDEEPRQSLVEPGAEQFGEPIVHEELGRKPTVVHRQERTKSREGLLNEYLEDEGSIGGSPDIDQGESPGDEMQIEEVTKVGRAQSVEYKSHARQVSAGSARLLDITSSRHSRNVSGQSTPASRAMSPTDADRPRQSAL